MRLALYKSTTKGKAEPLTKSGLGSVVFLLFLHVGLALLFREVRIFSTIHALLALGLGLYTALTTKDLAEVVPFAAYIMGAEVLWRMTKANVFWEYGKYAMVFLFLVALLKQRKSLKNFIWPLFSFLLLIPSVFITVDTFGLSETTRDFISFNLSGPLAVFMCIVFFSQVTLDEETLKKTVWAAVYPIIGILTLAVTSTLTATDIYFGTESVFVTSGGFGPNQVSAMLGLGALLLILYAIQPGKFKGRTLAIILSLLLIIQSFLTFSRGGIVNLAISLGGAFIFLLRNPSKLVRPFFVLFIILVIVGYIIFPQLETLTEGALSARFTDLDPVTRIDIVKADFELFRENPIAGVGPGMSSYSRAGWANIASHTEYSRIIADHGILGILSFVIIIILVIHKLFKTSDSMAQAWMVASAGWAAVEMAHAAMRIVAIAFMLGFAFVTFEFEKAQLDDNKNRSNRFYRFQLYKKKTNVR